METILRVFADGGKITVAIQNKKVVAMSVVSKGKCIDQQITQFIKELGDEHGISNAEKTAI